MDSINIIGAYGFYRHALNDIQDRIDATEDDAVLGKLGEAGDALRAAFLEEVFPDLSEMEEGFRYPPVETSADLAGSKTTDRREACK